MDTTTTFDNGPLTAGSSKPFGDARDPRLDNQPPLEDRLLMEFEEELEREGIKARVGELLESARRVPETIEDEATAGKVGDLCKLARDVEKRISEAREKHNRPLLNAQRGLKAKADGVYAPLESAINTIRQRLNAFIAREDAKRREEQRLAEEEARRAREALERENVAPEVIADVVQAPAPPPKPVARGDLGSRVGGRTVKKFERLVPIAKLPKQILESEKVVAAVDQVIGQMVRSGVNEIKGVRIYEAVEAQVR